MDSHQRRTFNRALKRALAGLQLSVTEQAPHLAKEPAALHSKRVLSTSSIEAYTFFIATAVYAVMTAFGIPISFEFGAGLSVVIALCALDLMWHSPATVGQRTYVKVLVAILIILVTANVIRGGWLRTHAKVVEPDNAALANLVMGKVTDLISKFQQPSTTHIEAPPPTAVVSQTPFLADMGPILWTPDRSTAFMALASNPPTQNNQVLPAQMAAEMIFTNGDHAVLISNYHLEARTGKGEWIRLLRVDSTGRHPYMLSTSKTVLDALPTAARVLVPLFDEQIYDRAISPHEALKGWIFFQYPRSDKKVTYSGQWRLVVTDTAGEKMTTPTIPGKSTLPNDNPQGAGIKLIGTEDLSSKQVTYLDD